MEWDQCSGERSHQLLESQQSYETEWDMVNAVSFKKKTCTNGEGELSSSASYHMFMCSSFQPLTGQSGLNVAQNESVSFLDKLVSLQPFQLLTKFNTDLLIKSFNIDYLLIFLISLLRSDLV